MAFKMPTADEMRAEFHKLNAEIAAIEEKAAPFRKKYDDLRRQENEFEEKYVRPARQAMELAEAQLFEKKQQLGMLSKALGGRVGEPDGAEAAEAQ